jgi:Tfp pilus assembly protein PilZ
VFGRLGPRVAEGMRMVFDPEEHTRRDLILACARGESIPYFRRAEPRFPARLEVRVRSETGLVIITHTQDISARGMMLTTDHRLEVGTMVALRIAFPDQSEPMTVAARIQSHVQHGARRGLGVEFQFASQDQRAFLAARIAALMAD